jgi:protein-S-isoprenylcysteine O-methyltransferase Ste14
MRHPGYAADIVMWLGAGLATTNFLTLVAVQLVVVAAYRARLVAEEAMLLAAFGDEFGAYARRTWRLVPLVY